MAELIQTIALSGFDPADEPEIRVMSDGGLCLVFNFMPPSDVEDREEAFFGQLDQELQTALGVPVVWEDRERFVIPSPKEDTIQSVTSFIKTCRRMSRTARSQKTHGVRTAFHDAVSEFLAPQGFQFRKSEAWQAHRVLAGIFLLPTATFVPAIAFMGGVSPAVLAIGHAKRIYDFPADSE